LNGLDILKNIRAKGLETPVIFLTGHSDPVFEETALLVGAVDFMVKSRGFFILYSRVRLVVNGAKISVGHIMPFEAGENAVDRSEDTGLRFRSSMVGVQWNGGRVRLSASEVRVVHHLTENSERFVGHREIYDIVKGHGFSAGAGPDGYRTNVRALLKRVRQKFREVDPGFDKIETYPGLGYRWCGELGGIDVEQDESIAQPCRPEPIGAPGATC